MDGEKTETEDATETRISSSSGNVNPESFDGIEDLKKRVINVYKILFNVQVDNT